MGTSCSTCQPCNAPSLSEKHCVVQVEEDVVSPDYPMNPQALAVQRHPSASSQDVVAPAEHRSHLSTYEGFGSNLLRGSAAQYIDPRNTAMTAGQDVRQSRDVRDQPYPSHTGWSLAPPDRHTEQVQGRFSDRVQAEINHIRPAANSFSSQYNLASNAASMPQGLFFGNEAVDAYVTYDKSSELHCGPAFRLPEPKHSYTSLPPVINVQRSKSIPTPSAVPPAQCKPSAGFDDELGVKKSVVKFFLPTEVTATSPARKSQVSEELSFT